MGTAAGPGTRFRSIRRVLRTGAGLLTDKQRDRFTAVFAVEAHVQVEATWGIYQRIVTAYRHPDRAAGKTALAAVITALSHDVPPALTELITLGRTLRRRAGDVLAYFDRPGTPNGPTEAIDGRLEHLLGSAYLGFRNLTNYITRSLLDTGGFRDRIHPGLRRTVLGTKFFDRNTSGETTPAFGPGELNAYAGRGVGSGGFDQLRLAQVELTSDPRSRNPNPTDGDRDFGFNRVSGLTR